MSGDTKCYRSQLTRVSSGLLAERTRKVSFRRFLVCLYYHDPSAWHLHWYLWEEWDHCHPHQHLSQHIITQFMQYQWVLDRLVPIITVVMSNPSSCGYQRALSDLSLLPCVAVCTNCEHLPTWLGVGLQRCAPHNCISQNGLSVPKLLRKTVWYVPCMQLVHVLHYSCTVRACCCTCN